MFASKFDKFLLSLVRHADTSRVICNGHSIHKLRADTLLDGLLYLVYIKAVRVGLHGHDLEHCVNERVKSKEVAGGVDDDHISRCREQLGDKREARPGAGSDEDLLLLREIAPAGRAGCNPLCDALAELSVALHAAVLQHGPGIRAGRGGLEARLDLTQREEAGVGVALRASGQSLGVALRKGESAADLPSPG